tara:strand:+ start:915 stop:1370 length:456 start_codon:yes stop_codon:yes gene_type:complete
MLTKDDINNIIDSPNLTSHEICDVIKSELNIAIDPGLSREEMVKEVYDAYQLALQEIENRKAEAAVGSGKPSTGKTTPQASFKKSAKAFILDLIKEGKHSKKDLIEITNTERGYAARGASCKTRVSRVIRELSRNQSLETTADGLLRYIGE